MATIEDVLCQDFEALDQTELLQSCKAHRKFLKEARSEVNQLQLERSKHQRVCSFPASLASENRTNWIRAEIDDPDDTTSFLCFRGKPKFSKIIAFKPEHYLKTQSRQVFEKAAGESRIIFSRLPSKRSRTLYVFVESSATGASSTEKKYRLSAKPTPPCGFVAHWTIHLKKLSWMARVKVLIGQIEWVYIVVPDKVAKVDLY